MGDPGRWLQLGAGPHRVRRRGRERHRHKRMGPVRNVLRSHWGVDVLPGHHRPVTRRRDRRGQPWGRSRAGSQFPDEPEPGSAPGGAGSDHQDPRLRPHLRPASRRLRLAVGIHRRRGVHAGLQRPVPCSGPDSLDAETGRLEYDGSLASLRWSLQRRRTAEGAVSLERRRPLLAGDRLDSGRIDTARWDPCPQRATSSLPVTTTWP